MGLQIRLRDELCQTCERARRRKVADETGRCGDKVGADPPQDQQYTEPAGAQRGFGERSPSKRNLPDGAFLPRSFPNRKCGFVRGRKNIRFPANRHAATTSVRVNVSGRPKAAIPPAAITAALT